jgi:acyl-CoA synthetase (NDP forming)
VSVVPPEIATGGRGPRQLDNLRRLLAPRHVAFVGGRDAAVSLRQCVAFGFKGEIWPVNPHRDNLEGRPCFPSIEDLPEAPDAAFVAVNREATVEVVRRLAARGAGGAICYAAGFAERGCEGARLQAALVEAAGEMAVVGPNCYGLLNYLDGAVLWSEGHGGRPAERGVAIVSQSGNISLNLTMEQRSLPIAYVISVGNQACLGFDRFVAALVEDPRVSAIGLYVEGLADIPGFARAAAAALEKGVPVVALKVGSSEIGARIALSHTSSLVGSESLYRALFERLGVVRAPSLGALLETLKFLHVVGPLPGRRLGVLCCSGGEAALLADLAARHGLELPDLSEDQKAELAAQLPDFVTLSNPFDYNTSVWGNSPALERCFSTMMVGAFDTVMLLLDYPRPDTPGNEGWHAAFEAFLAAGKARGRRLAVTSTLPELLPEEARLRSAAVGVAPMQGLDEAVVAIAGAARYAEQRARIDPAQAAQLLPPPPANPGRPLRTLGEWECKQRLAAAGLRVPEGRVVDAAGAPSAARALGFPVALKALHPALAHKTEAGAVALGLHSEAAVEAAASRIASALAGLSGADARFLIERMVEGVVAELIIGVTHDPQFGLALVVGAGGIGVALASDSATVLLRGRREGFAAALGGLKIARLLDGFRGRPAGDREAVIGAMQTVAAFAEAERDSLRELDVNPLMVLSKGAGVVVADALIRLQEN